MPAILEQWKVLPHDPLVRIDDGILSVTGEIRMPLGNFPRRMTAVRLRGERVAIYSAIALGEAEMAEIEALGRPAFLIVPGDMHRMDASIWKDRYPDIRVVTPPGARARVEEVVPVGATDDVLDDPDARLVIVPGTGGHEAALEVRRDGRLTLVTNDVIGNVAHPHGIGAQIMGRLMGFGVEHPQVPHLVRRMIVDDPDALAVQFRTWAADRELTRILVSHGDVIEADAPQVLRALAEALE